jgi:hypothetical protein
MFSADYPRLERLHIPPRAPSCFRLFNAILPLERFTKRTAGCVDNTTPTAASAVFDNAESSRATPEHSDSDGDNAEELAAQMKKIGATTPTSGPPARHRVSVSTPASSASSSAVKHATAMGGFKVGDRVCASFSHPVFFENPYPRTFPRKFFRRVFFHRFFESPYLSRVMHGGRGGSDRHDHECSRVLPTVFVVKIFSSLVPPTHSVDKTHATPLERPPLTKPTNHTPGASVMWTIDRT